MADSTRISRGEGGAAKRAAARVSGQRLTRRRVPVSCTACRGRKLKCNREHPCQNCVARGEANAATCEYAEKTDRRLRHLGGQRGDGEEMRKRLNHLESSILSLLETRNEPQQSESLSSSSERNASEPPTKVQAGGQKISVDTRSTHWDAILNEIGAMKDAWSEENDKIEYETTSGAKFRPSLLNGLVEPPDRAAILASLPGREECDGLVGRFFKAYNPLIPARFLLHRKTFLKQYAKHWLAPHETKIIWIGLLYSIICFAMHSYGRGNEIPPEYGSDYAEITDLYRIRTAQCIAIADITKPSEFMIETIILYSFSEFSSEGDGDMGTFLISGTMIRIALQQGLHRDPSEHPNLTIFQGEMRRRLWCAAAQHEMIFSGLVGLPKFIKHGDCDTQLPSNLHEDELYEEMKVMPPSRPLSEATEITYQVIKAELMRGYGFVLEFLHSLGPQPYNEVMRLDLNLMRTRERFPAHLQFGTLEEMKDDPPWVIIEKYILQHFYHKSIVVLHRKFWDGAPLTAAGKFNYYSRKTCVTSALALLHHQAIIHRGCQPGGPLVKIKWYQFVVMNHDYLLAAIVLCLDVMNMRFVAGSNIPHCVITESDKLEALRETRVIWGSIRNECHDAPRAIKILDTLLSKVYSQRKQLDLVDGAFPLHSMSGSNLVPTITSGIPPQPQRNEYMLSNSAVGYGYEVPAIGGATVENMDDGNGNVPMTDSFWNALGSPNLELPADFNWDIWDQFMVNQTQFSQDSLGVGFQEVGVNI